MAPIPAPVRVTFAEVATGEGGYFEQQARRVKRGKLKPYTLHRDRRTYALHCEELFGHVVFEELGAEEIGDWVDDHAPEVRWGTRAHAAVRAGRATASWSAIRDDRVFYVDPAPAVPGALGRPAATAHDRLRRTGGLPTPDEQRGPS